MPAPRMRRVVMGVGNPHRGDDGVGHAVARRLAGSAPPDVDVVLHQGDAASLLAGLEGVAAAYLIDACASSAPAGTVHRFDVGSGPLPLLSFAMSTHGLGLAEAVELGRALGQLPDRCVVYAVEVGSVGPGAAMSAAVVSAITEVEARVRGELG